MLGASTPSDAMTSPLARPESLNRYAYVVDSPASAADPSGNFILAADCFLDSLLPECQCDPENGCPPELLLLFPPPILGRASAATSAGPCPGTMDCSYYAKQCADPAVPNKSYYCTTAPHYCQVFGKSRVADCIRLCLQVQDTCSSKPGGSGLDVCIISLHVKCYANCIPKLSCY